MRQCPLMTQSGPAKVSRVSIKEKPGSPGTGPSSMGGTSQSNIAAAESQETFMRIPPPLVFLLAISQTQDVRNDAVGIIIFDHKVRHCTVRCVQPCFKCSGCHSWNVRNSCESWRLLICRAAFLLYD